MQPHIHIGLAETLIVFAGVLVCGAAWRYLAFRQGDTPTARAMLFVY